MKNGVDYTLNASPFQCLETGPASSKGFQPAPIVPGEIQRYRPAENMTHEVGTKATNSLEIYDMSGNVWEMCYDIYNDDVTIDDTIEDNVVIDPIGAASGNYRLLHGGNWYDEYLLSSVYFRYSKCPPNGTSALLGFRLVRSVKHD